MVNSMENAMDGRMERQCSALRCCRCSILFTISIKKGNTIRWGFGQIYAFERRLGQHFCEITIFTLAFLRSEANQTTDPLFSCFPLTRLCPPSTSIHLAHTSIAEKVPTEKCLQLHSSECGKSSRLVIVARCRPPTFSSSRECKQ